MDKLDGQTLKVMSQKADKALEIRDLITDLGERVDTDEFGTQIRKTLGNNRMHPAPRDTVIGTAALHGIVEVLRARYADIEGEIGHTVDLDPAPQNPFQSPGES